MFEFISAQAAHQAIDLATPLIEGLIQADMVKRHDLHVLVARRQADGTYTVLAERSYGDSAKWEQPFDEIAHSKARITSRTGLTSREVQLMRPGLLEPGDIKFWGSAILDPIIVACSGFQPWYDEAVANAVAWLCQAAVDQLRDDAQALSGYHYPEA